MKSHIDNIINKIYKYINYPDEHIRDSKIFTSKKSGFIKANDKKHKVVNVCGVYCNNLFNKHDIYKNKFNVYKEFVNEIYINSYNKSVEYVTDHNENNIYLKQDDVKLIAFYLPQFHTIPENDKWWGKGFTEWSNVTRAVPQYKGHHQPQLPVDMGFYDLKNPDILERQIALAQKYGIYGFCFHYYWFGGKKLLEKPIDIFFSCSEKYNFPFCFCWANENWTRRWDGSENELLIAQKYSSKNDFALVRELKKYFVDKRYIKIEGKPILIVYRPQIIPKPSETIMRWRKICHDNGIGEIFLIGAKTFGLEDPSEHGFDAAVEFPPHNIGTFDISNQINIMNPNFRGRIYDYYYYVKNRSYLKEDPCLTFKTVFPGWDNTARKPNDSLIFYGSSPTLYKEWLDNVIDYTKIQLDKHNQFIFINAWNEWAEGAHLEPDRRYGYSFLQSTSEAIIDSRKNQNINC